MSLLAPLFLAGLGLLIVPIIIHLTQRQRSQVTAFPSLMFLRKVPFKTTNRRRIRHPLLFALRCLAIALLALVFARPFFVADGGPAGQSARDVVVVVDVSASLGFEDRWEAALDSARAVVTDLVEGDRIAIVSFAEQAEERLGLTENLEAAGEVLGGLELTQLGTRLDAGLQLAGRILAESERASREVVLISDFQRTGWEDGGRLRLPDGVSLRAASLAEGDAANIAVAGAALQTTPGGRARVLARLTNMGDEPVEALPVSLELGGRAVATLPIDIAPRGASAIAFEDVALPAGRTRGRLTIPADGLEIDNSLRFMASSEAGLRALILESNRGRDDRSLFVERALSIGDAPRIDAVRRPSAQIDAADLGAAAMVILNDGDLSDAGRADQLRDWVAGGGGALIVLGPNGNPGRWSDAGRTLLGGTLGALADQTSVGGSRLVWLDYDHPVFELFSAPRSGDFSEARFFRFWNLEPAEGTSVLARYQDGEAALLEHSVGEGRVLIWTSTLDKFWNDLALQPVFLPFLHRMVLHATDYREPQRWIRTGGVLELAVLTAGEGESSSAGVEGEWILVSPDGDREPIEVAEGPTWVEFVETGFYEIESRDDVSRATWVAVNAPLEEADLVPVAPERVVEAVVGVTARDGEATAGAIDEETAERRSELWWPLLILAVLVLGAESVIANRWTRRRPTSGLARST